MLMRTIPAAEITRAVARLCVDANLALPPDVALALRGAKERENSPSGREILAQLEENARLAALHRLPLCQDTGQAVFFVELGNELRIEGASLAQAINAGVAQGYGQGRLRKSLCHPLTRQNTGDNTPASIHISSVPGSGLRIFFMAKGGGSENKSRLVMLPPSAGWAGIKDFVLESVRLAGPDPCPPVILGLGIGGSFDLAPLLAKKALLRPLDVPNPEAELRPLEEELLLAVNSLNIGPMGLGGLVSCLGVKINMAPCHIASLPVALNIQCHSSRHAEIEL